MDKNRKTENTRGIKITPLGVSNKFLRTCFIFYRSVEASNTSNERERVWNVELRHYQGVKNLTIFKTRTASISVVIPVSYKS